MTTEQLNPGYYLCVKNGHAPGLIEVSAGSFRVPTLLVPCNDPRSLGYTLHSVAELLELQTTHKDLQNQYLTLLKGLQKDAAL